MKSIWQISNLVKKYSFEENDNKKLKSIYEEWVKLEKDGQEEKAVEKMDEFYTILLPYYEKLYPTPTFEEFIEKFELDIPAESLAKLKDIYDKAQKAEKDDNADMSEKLWEDFYYIMDQFITPPTFEEYMADYEFKISEADSKQLKQLYEEILKLDKKEDKAKIEEKWEAFNNILEPYFIANKEILITASKVTINGQEYTPQ